MSPLVFCFINYDSLRAADVLPYQKIIIAAYKKKINGIEIDEYP
jgi:hypothetical protein